MKPENLYSGNVVLKPTDGKDLVGNGHVAFEWLPRPRTTLSCTVSPRPEDDEGHRGLVYDKGDDSPIGVSVPVVLDEPGEFKFRPMEHSKSIDDSGRTVHKVSGPVCGRWGQCGTRVRVNKVEFVIPNVRNGSRKTTWSFDKWQFQITPRNGETLQSLKNDEGYAATHFGEITQKEEHRFTWGKVNRELEALSYLLSFANGRWTEPTMPVGRNRGDVILKVWHSPRIAAFRGVRSWCDSPIESLPQLYEGFRLKWQDDTWKDVIRNGITWYLVAIAPGAFIENATILSCVFFEMVGSTLLVEDTGVLTDEAYGRLIAEDVIRLLLAQLRIPANIPPDLPKLHALAKAKNWDGPKAVTKVRNCIVHHTKKKRDKLEQLGMELEREVHALSLEYVELVLLGLFGYRGNYTGAQGHAM